jgi:type I restriction enzyme M protein
MQWIASSEKNPANNELEKRLWQAADQLRANSGLTAQQYSGPVLGLIFLRFAEVRFAKRRKELEGQTAGTRRGSRLDDAKAYTAEGIIFLGPDSRFDFLLGLPEGANIGSKLNDAMRAIERDNPQLAGVLPKTFNIFTSPLLKQLLKRVSEIPAGLDYDAFGRIYEYFLGEFARTEGSKGGEWSEATSTTGGSPKGKHNPAYQFYTPASIVRFIVEVLEPYHGSVYDPATGSGGMFAFPGSTKQPPYLLKRFRVGSVQSAHFVAEHRKNPARELSIHGHEKVGATVVLSRMNLAMHGLEGDVREAISYYDDPHESTGRFDFVLANPPFNVNAVDKGRLEGHVGHQLKRLWDPAGI